MAAVMRRDGIDAEPPLATCDVCAHRHACYVGGHDLATDGGAVSWETHVCLGCLMRAGPIDDIEACGGCAIEPRSGPRAPSTWARPMHELTPVLGMQRPAHDALMLREPPFATSPATHLGRGARALRAASRRDLRRARTRPGNAGDPATPHGGSATICSSATSSGSRGDGTTHGVASIASPSARRRVGHVARIGRLEVAQLGKDLAPKELDRGRVVGFGRADDDVLHAGLGQPAETLDDLIGALGSPAPGAALGQGHALEVRPLDLGEVAADGVTVSRPGSRTSAGDRPGRRTCSTRRRIGRRAAASSSRRRRRS